MALKQLVLESLTNEWNQDDQFNLNNEHFLNDSRLDVVIFLIDQLEWSRDKKVAIITAIHLLQVASDVLHLISNDKLDRNRSLVLQADRLSSQAYILLSKYEEFRLMKRMARAVKEINELKIKAFQMKETEPRCYMKNDKMIRWTIILHLMECYELTSLKGDVKTFLNIEIPNLSEDVTDDEMQFTKEYIHIENDLMKTDQILLSILSKADEPIKTMTVQLLTAGGKRVRPLLYLISSYFGDQDHTYKYQLAAILELIHMSSLVHDDVVDQAPLRRGIPTIHTTYSHDVAIYVGNFLFAQALELLANIDDGRVHRIISKTLKDLTTGELEQLNSRFTVDQSLKNYLKRNRNKTAQLIAVSSQLGALLNGAPDEIHERLYTIGYNIGMSYQIIDDILDFTEKSEKFGKRKGQDLLEGHLTLPSILASNDKQFANRIENYFDQRKNGHEPDFEEIINEIIVLDAIEQSDQYSQWYLRRALRSIKKLPDQTEKKLLFQAIGFLMKRNY